MLPLGGMAGGRVGRERWGARARERTAALRENRAAHGPAVLVKIDDRYDILVQNCEAKLVGTQRKTKFAVGCGGIHRY